MDETIREDAYLSEEQLCWLINKLHEKRSSDENNKLRPIFIFIHQPIHNTLEGSETERGIVQYNQLRHILLRYPQVILFSGHTHYDLENTKQLVFSSFYMVGSGSVRQVRGQHDSRFAKSESLIVEVYDNRVVIKKGEHVMKRWISPNDVIYFPQHV